jgi:hypothetical protein
MLLNEWLKFAAEGFVEDGGEEGVQFGRRFDLKALEGVHLLLQCVQLSHDSTLFGKWWLENHKGFQLTLINRR